MGEGVGGYDQLCCPASPKLLLGLDLGLGCDDDLKLGISTIGAQFSARPPFLLKCADVILERSLSVYE